MMIEPIEFLAAKTVPKKWGGELIWVSNEQYCGKQLIFDKGKKMSFHMHRDKTETWQVIQGKLLMRYFDLSNANEIERILNFGDIVHIPAGNPHQLEALEDSVVNETSTMDLISDNYRIRKGDSQT